MINTQWYSFKHNANAIVLDVPRTRNGYYTIQLTHPNGEIIYRRYNADRINKELKEFKSVNRQLDAQLNPIELRPHQVNEILGDVISGSSLARQLAVYESLNNGAFNGEIITLNCDADKIEIVNGKLIGLVFE